MTARVGTKVHADPIWRERANFIIRAAIEEGGAEQLWARQAGDRRFEICCIPFFLYDVALGDLVETDDDFDLVRVVEPSGRFVFRAWFGDSGHPPELVTRELEAAGGLLEWSSANLVAVDAADEPHAQAIAALLAEHERAGRLEYETGRS